MGIDSRRAPPLPAPTETETNTPTELTVDAIKPTDGKSTVSIPEDGTPVTIPTRHKANKSQTSLLIEYFEGGKTSPGTGERRPSVRVRLTPSKKGRGDHIQVTKGTRKASATKRITLDQLRTDSDFGEDANSMSSYASATEESNVSRHPIEVDIDHSRRRRRPASPLIPTSESYPHVNPSQISEIPSDSFLDGTGNATDQKGSFSTPRGENLATAAVAGAAAGAAMNEINNYKSRTGKKERVKLSDKPKESSDRGRERKHRSKSRTSSVSERGTEDVKTPRRRSSRGHQESAISAADSSVLSSNLTPSHRSGDTHSTRSGVSKSSINNPKLLETVEDAIRRLILPELSALKREQSKRESRRSSFTSSNTTTSKDDVSTDRRRSLGQRSDSKRNREARHDYGDSSPLSVSRESFHDGYDYDTDPTTPKQSGLLKAAAAGAAAAAVGKGLSSGHDDKPQSEERKQRERRRRRTESARSRSLGRDRYADEYEDDLTVPAPPMPLMSEINPSEMTRTSILSADTDRPHSASEEMTPIQHVNRGLISPDSTPTPTRTPANLEEPFTQHANVSHGDLTALPRGEKKDEEYGEDEFGNKTNMGHDQYDDDQDVSDPDDYPDNSYEATYFATQEVPPPLKYVPYQAGARGLSPIPSVSGYTEGGSEYQPRHSRSIHSNGSDVYSGIDKSPEHRRNSRSIASMDSLRNRDRDFDGASQRSSGIDYRNTQYTDDSELDRVMTGQAVRGVGANPNFVHPPLGVESNVASLIDGSMLDQSVLTSQSGYNSYNGPRDSQLSYDDQSRVSQSSRGASPEKRYGGLRDSEISYDEQSRVSQSSRGASPDKRSIDSRREVGEERHATPSGRSHKQSQEFSEYELDEHGRKVAARTSTRSPTASEAAITAGAVGAAAAALRAAKEQQRPIQEEEEVQHWEEQEEYVPAGVFRNKSFKERTLEGHEPRNTPAHSIDRLSYDEPKMSATGIPDWNNPMPEYGYLDDDLQTNPSIIQDRLDGERMDVDESGRSTPTQKDITGHQHGNTQTKDGGLGITETAAVAALGAAAGMAAAHAHSREPSHDHDEWQRTSDEKKRDTLVTNPYEDASPIANPGLNENLLARGLGPSYGAGYHTGSPGFGQNSPGFGQKYDEGYMSNGPNRTPDANIKGKGLDLTAPPGGEDPFYVPKDRHYSGMSQGMASPFYDAATGQGIDRIENKDIVALMQHLMVRDAQRSARDTEIVALLMNAALEMRTQFREMKDLIQDTGDDVIFAGVENTEKLTKAINGPRPYPGTRSSIQSVSQLDTLNDVAKKKNFLKRALQGLSAKGTSDLSRIEDMLMQLLGEVDVLKTQTAPPASTPGRSPSLTNLQPEGQYEHDRGYEPEGNSTASHASQSGHLSLNQSRNPSFRLTGERKFSDHRISTVQENEEEYEYDHPSPSMERTNPNLLTPGRADIPRGGSVPLDTPPQHSGVFQQPLSAENTPRTEKAKKHKSGGSTSWLPKFSRWSGTTTSSVGKAFKKKETKYDDYAPSRSGSSLASYNDDLYDHNPYEEDKLHTGFSEQNLDAPSQPQAETGPSKRDPLTADDPKYKAHRNSLNLQHPQPRPGQTERFRNALEYSAQEYDNPMTPRSTDWAGSATSLNRLPTNANRYSNTSSSGAQQQQQQQQPQEPWRSSSTGPPLPPKEPIESPSARTPPKSNRISRLAKSSPLYQSEESAYGAGPTYTSSSPKPENRNLNAALGIPARRPSGPRSMTPKSPEQDARDERRRKRDTFGTIGSHHTDDTDTF